MKEIKAELRVQQIDDSTWESLVERSESPVVVMFYSPTCPHCRAMQPHFRELADVFHGKIRFAQINVLDNAYTTNRYGIISTPTFKFFCSGRPVQELVGEVHPAILKRLIKDALDHGPSCAERSSLINYDMAYV
ncbi:MAG: Thioredoxin [Methanosaeta sp. PtaB.Bin039]|nr:MAG: Thioredoxin [Methanosaeta sp. PtaB.Bin039]OPY44756.1 MAG: Thioredoxin [Methanosaeta sp. PtaU1.Bin028]HOT07168.1 thioredoxin family protein [Methanotrichaceae archaeon]HQF16889.1 thioredoxin family protein [Methanotrichaceae archaeon]HQI91455.1 thioredoxin family protein [Methanotrichaceae archaeon]